MRLPETELYLISDTISKMAGSHAYSDFLEIHKQQLESSNVPKIFWEPLWKKLQTQKFDAFESFKLARIDYDDSQRGPKDPNWKLFVSTDTELSAKDPNNIYLIDHAWIYEVQNARKNLSQIPNLLDRMSNFMGCDTSKSEGERIDFVISEMWRYSQAFSLSSGTIEERMPLWYIMDEIGSAINHSDLPNFRTVPFLYRYEGISYTLLFPIRDVDKEEEVTRDYIEGLTSDPEKRRALLLPWFDADFTDQDFTQDEPSSSYFTSGRIVESLPVVKIDRKIIKPAQFKVYSDYIYVTEYLKDPRFRMTDNKDEADILWLLSHFKDYEDLSVRLPNTFINQFPFEHVLTVKDLLAAVCRRKVVDKKYDPETLRTYPSWLPTTYNLSTELLEFVAYYQQREIRDLDNHWICKPWNLARGLDTFVTKNLNHIVRLPSAGPKIAQKYIENPVLFTRLGIGKVKFDIRYVILLKSVEPLRAYAYTNFFLRFANREFGLDNFDVYEQHFTVMNYAKSSELHHLHCDEFIVQWNEMYPGYEWKTRVEPRILLMLRELLEAAIAVKAPCGIAHSPQSRAVYAVDLMLEWREDDMQTVLLEVNFSPDNKRACEYYPLFYNQIFECLFLDIVDPAVFHDLSVEDENDKRNGRV